MLIYKLDIIFRADVGKYAVFARAGADGEIIVNIIFRFNCKKLKQNQLWNYRKFKRAHWFAI